MKHWAWALALSCAMPVSAAIIPTASGLVDTSTGLEWQSLLFSRGDTWAAASSIPGYRLASAAEVTQLFADAGISSPSGLGVNPGVQLMLSTWGALGGDHGSRDSDFWVADTHPDGTHAVGFLEAGV